VACENLAAMAVDELSADGGLHGRRVRMLVADDAKDPGRRRVRGPPDAGWCSRGRVRADQRQRAFQGQSRWKQPVHDDVIQALGDLIVLFGQAQRYRRCVG
jgi:hypothetical protein